ncbi:hypothetical protein GCM10027294_26340 [Marinactinospora endophytica]
MTTEGRGNMAKVFEAGLDADPRFWRPAVDEPPAWRRALRPSPGSARAFRHLGADPLQGNGHTKNGPTPVRFQARGTPRCASRATRRIRPADHARSPAHWFLGGSGGGGEASRSAPKAVL